MATALERADAWESFVTATHAKACVLLLKLLSSSLLLKLMSLMIFLCDDC